MDQMTLKIMYSDTAIINTEGTVVNHEVRKPCLLITEWFDIHENDTQKVFNEMCLSNVRKYKVESRKHFKKRNYCRLQMDWV